MPLTAEMEKALKRLGISYDNTPVLYQSSSAALTALINEVLDIADDELKVMSCMCGARIRALKLGEPE